MPRSIKIIRHGERLDFTNPLYWLLCVGQYWADSPLTINGAATAKNKGDDIKNDGFRPTYIYTSPYSRTLATSTEISKAFTDIQIVIEPLLAEYQPQIAHHINLYPGGIPTTRRGTNTHFSYPESYDKFTERVMYIIGQIVSEQPDDCVIITHGEVLKVYINYLQNVFPDLDIDPGTTPYLTTISFTVNDDDRILENTVTLQ
jgi:broad specificity phosphatase PhoE